MAPLSVVVGPAYTTAAVRVTGGQDERRGEPGAYAGGGRGRTCASPIKDVGDAFRRPLDKVDGIRCVLGLFEGVVTGAADGYWRMADRPAATLLHLGPGLGNGLANLHNARKASSGIVNIVGEHATYHIKHDAPLTSDIEGIARPVSAWVRTSPSARSVAADGRRRSLRRGRRPFRSRPSSCRPTPRGTRPMGFGRGPGARADARQRRRHRTACRDPALRRADHAHADGSRRPRARPGAGRSIATATGARLIAQGTTRASSAGPAACRSSDCPTRSTWRSAC